MGKHTNRNWAIGVIAVLGFAYLVGVFGPLGYPSPVGIDLLGGSVINDGKTAPVKFSLIKRGTATAVETADVYAWYDWDGDGAVDLGEYPEGEIETLASAATTGLVTTSLDYPVNRDILFQIHKAGYEVETFARRRTTIPASHDGSALAVANVLLSLTDTGASRVSINGELLVTATTDYNFTLSGAEPACEFVHTATTGDAGISEDAFVHWSTGKSYAGTFLGMIFLNQDFIDLKPSGYSGVFTGASNTYVWYFVDGYFNDADVVGDERYSLFFNLDISAAGDIANIGLYNGVEVDDLSIGVWNTVLGTEETGLDIVA